MQWIQPERKRSRCRPLGQLMLIAGGFFWSQLALGSQFLLVTLLSGVVHMPASEAPVVRQPQFQVWLYDHVEIKASVYREETGALGNAASLDMCINSPSEVNPAHLTVAIQPRKIDPELRTLSRYSVYLAGRDVRRNPRGFFDFLVSSSPDCNRAQRFKFRYRAVSDSSTSLGRQQFMDTITLTISPE